MGTYLPVSLEPRAFKRREAHSWEFSMAKTARLVALLAAEEMNPPDLSVLRDRVAADRARIRMKLDRLKSNGARVCGYGAPAQLTTTCYALGITVDDVSFICDDSALKRGRYTPGRGIPIVSPAELHNSDACLIFSANFSDAIRAKHASYQGEWIEV